MTLRAWFMSIYYKLVDWFESREESDPEPGAGAIECETVGPVVPVHCYVTGSLIRFAEDPARSMYLFERADQVYRQVVANSPEATHAMFNGELREIDWPRTNGDIAVWDRLWVSDGRFLLRSEIPKNAWYVKIKDRHGSSPQTTDPTASHIRRFSGLDPQLNLVLRSDVGDPDDFVRKIPTFFPIGRPLNRQIFGTELGVWYDQTLKNDATHLQVENLMVRIDYWDGDKAHLTNRVVVARTAENSHRWWKRKIRDLRGLKNGPRVGRDLEAATADIAPIALAAPEHPTVYTEAMERAVSFDGKPVYYPMSKPIPLAYSLRSAEHVYAKCSPADATHVLFEVGLGASLRKIVKRENFKLHFEDKSTIDMADVPESGWVRLHPEPK